MDKGVRSGQTLYGTLDARSEKIGAELTARIREQIPSYATVPLPEHQRTVTGQFRTLVGALATRSGPTADQLLSVRTASRRRVAYGLPVYDVLAAFHIVAREVWDLLRETARAEGDVEDVTDLVDPLWQWIQAMSGMVADAYAEESGARHGHDAALRQRLFEALRGGGDVREQGAEIARTLGFDPDGPFRAVCGLADHWSHGQLDVLQRAGRGLRGILQCGLRGQSMITLTQGVDQGDLLRKLRSLGGDQVVLGVGLARDGLDGAEMSISDAERSLPLAEPGTAAHFDDVWLQASLADSHDRLRPLFGDVRRVAQEQPQLAETVRAYAGSGFSLAATAERLTIHPNTVAYRLGQWEKLTGLDPRSYPGLVRSVVGLGGRPGIS